MRSTIYAWSLKWFNLQVRRKPHGKKLVNKYVVGTCTEPCSGIYIKNRGEVNYLSERDIPSNIGKQVKIVTIKHILFLYTLVLLVFFVLSRSLSLT